MQYHHGIMVCDGQSLNGFLYGCGDPVVIYDDGRNEISTDEVYVLNLKNGQSIVVPLRLICWVPAYSEERHGRTFLFTLYGRRFKLPPDPEGSQDCIGSRAIQVSFGSTGHLDYSHTVLTEENLSTCAHRLQESERQAYCTLQWNLTSVRPFPADMDVSSERRSSVCLSSPSTTSPATPSSGMDVDSLGLLLRRDSAVDLSYQSTGTEGQALYGHVENNSFQDDPSGMLPPLGRFDSRFPRKNEARPQPQPQPSCFMSLAAVQPKEMSPWMEPYEAFLDPSFVSLNDMSSLQVNCLYLPPTNSSSAGPGGDQTQASQSEDNGVNWTANVGVGVGVADSTPGYVWSPVQFRQNAIATQEHNNCGSSIHAPSLVEGPPQIQQLTTAALPAPMADGHYHEAQRPSAGPPAPVFYRVQQSNVRTVGLTAGPESAGSSTASQKQRQRPKRRRSSDGGSKGRRSRRGRQKSPDPPPQYRPFRPELVADFFSRQVQLHVEPLEARSREHLLDPSSSAEALDLIRTAHTQVVKILGTLRSVTQEPFEFREARIRQDADTIIAVMQSIRSAALEDDELAEQDVLSLKQRVEAFVTYVEWVRDLHQTSEVAASENQAGKDGSKDSFDSGNNTAAASSTGGPENGPHSDSTAAISAAGFTAAAVTAAAAAPAHPHPSPYWTTDAAAPGAVEYGAQGLWPSVPVPRIQPPASDSGTAYPLPQTGAISHDAPLSAGQQQPSLYHPGYSAEFEGQPPGPYPQNTDIIYTQRRHSAR
ncbi:hypothetical protein SODALDRAFT_83498 [Sodiomyces alkalinus F11]|uniref:Uncharacterized protein n=1 Tax=Sodiomyces alkalinus (strain CBS 110278 / VKM F-3762 / F11) TaxID=1314773 RepID=A0A3N2PJJ9_SODAK|nr:hypothetical protein SODALDRAFT_83498 [Sodiomyces alkalinus F11]ROT34701.1 hypothetical protein SODALDRAFT_83498 [Sodiomyces alkalinus F11]